MGHVTSKIQVLLVASYLNLYIDKQKHWYIYMYLGVQCYRE